MLSGAVTKKSVLISTLNGELEAIGAWAMYQLFPASPLRPQTFLSSWPTRM